MRHLRHLPLAITVALAIPVAGVGITASSCNRGSKAPPAPPVPSAPLPPAAPPAPAAPADPEANAELIVGSTRGLEAWRRDGSDKRMISKGAALHPRRLDADSVIVLRASDANDLAKGGRFEKISLADGKRTKVALLPPFACAAPAAAAPEAGDQADEPTSLGLQDENDFVVDPAKRIAFVTLMDRNINMADIILNIRVDLATGKIERWLSGEGQEYPCAAPVGVTAGSPPNDVRPVVPRPALPPADPAFRFNLGEEEALYDAKAGTKPVLRMSGYATESISPSGRWAVLGGDTEEGDYIHRRLVLLDRTTGDLFPIREKGGAWPGALSRPVAAAGKPVPLMKLPISKTIMVVGESDTRWLGKSAASELLVIDALVVRPRGAAFSVKGSIAR